MKKLFISAIILASAFAFTACGNNANQNSGNADSAVVEAPVAEPAAVPSDSASCCGGKQCGDSASCCAHEGDCAHDGSCAHDKAECPKANPIE